MKALPIGRWANHEDPLRAVILISGRGSNMAAIVQAAQERSIAIRVQAVLSNEPDAPGLTFAREAGIQTESMSQRQVGDDAYHEWLVARLEVLEAEVLVLAGYMRLLPGWVVDRFPRRIVNIHPSLLPSFPGLHPHEQALSHGVKVSGCTVHLVDHGVDQGPIVMQKAVPVHDGDSPDDLASRVLRVEHLVYPQALALMTTGRLVLTGRRVSLLPERNDSSP